jgi:hypothetical protein
MTPHQLALTGLELRDQGIASLERHPWLDKARLASEAIMCLAGEGGFPGYLTSDDVHYEMLEPPPHDNCYGAVFKDKRFKSTGERVRSTRPEAHGRWIEVWRLA